MTDEIDLDELDVQDDEETPNRGDWFWSGEGDPEDEPDPGATGTASVRPNSDAEAESPDAATGTSQDGDTGMEGNDGNTASAARGGQSVPHVPRENKDKPVGIPTDSGGAGGAAATNTDPASNVAEDPAAGEEPVDASGPHGGGIDDMTMAVTYDAARQFADPQRVFREARAWADWVGIVGDVDAFVINKFQRDNGIDADFFSGAGQEPAERLADINEHSMFYAERMVLVGRPADEPIAERTGWEFISLADAAEKADWDLADG
ncbi:hypothetical protein SAMN05443574_114106 [Haloarcula vallismortis]|uniref:DUF7124 domain-containing protein n=2 Tax=Haloarcula vallismortis TaxID=28442 RepID=M0JN29_HALVA|nr:hypothetical protein [Haloarcula vallismortis]EMA09075.1 hypothetical protein C437_07178 [Haloarcula vallismortis ATCC 29715]SDX10840.1 hypothetical protein SAMN05443574_114106 [Haloarcula vallismortis]